MPFLRGRGRSQRIVSPASVPNNVSGQRTTLDERDTEEGPQRLKLTLGPSMSMEVGEGVSVTSTLLHIYTYPTLPYLLEPGASTTLSVGLVM